MTGTYDDLPRTPEGFVDFDAFFRDPEIQELILRESVPFWSIATRPDNSEERAPAQPSARGSDDEERSDP